MTDNQPTASGVSEEMVERFSRIACSADDDDPDKYWRDYAVVTRAILEAALSASPPQPIPTPDEALPENADERRMFDHSVVAIFDGNPLKAIAFALELEWKVLGREGSKACLCAIYANEIHAAMSRVAALSRARPEEDKS